MYTLPVVAVPIITALPLPVLPVVKVRTAMLLPILIIAHAAIVAPRAEQITVRVIIAVPAVTVIALVAIAAAKRKAIRIPLVVAPLPSRARNVKRAVPPVCGNLQKTAVVAAVLLLQEAVAPVLPVVLRAIAAK